MRDNVFVVERCDVDPADAKGTPDPDAHRKARLTARLVRPETLPVVGIVAVPDPDGPRGADIGKTDLGDVLVYDVAYGRTRYYLGVPKREAIRKGDCRMCHHADRLDGRNPHRIVLRRP